MTWSTIAETPFLAAARAAGVKCEGGLSMLVGQAALAIALWLDIEPPQPPMMERARQAIFGYKAESHS